MRGKARHVQIDSRHDMAGLIKRDLDYTISGPPM